MYHKTKGINQLVYFFFVAFVTSAPNVWSNLKFLSFPTKLRPGFHEGLLLQAYPPALPIPSLLFFESGCCVRRQTDGQTGGPSTPQPVTNPVQCCQLENRFAIPSKKPCLLQDRIAVFDLVLLQHGRREATLQHLQVDLAGVRLALGSLALAANQVGRDETPRQIPGLLHR